MPAGKADKLRTGSCQHSESPVLLSAWLARSEQLGGEGGGEEESPARERNADSSGKELLREESVPTTSPHTPTQASFPPLEVRAANSRIFAETCNHGRRKTKEVGEWERGLLGSNLGFSSGLD